MGYSSALWRLFSKRAEAWGWRQIDKALDKVGRWAEDGLWGPGGGTTTMGGGDATGGTLGTGAKVTKTWIGPRITKSIRKHARNQRILKRWSARAGIEYHPPTHLRSWSSTTLSTSDGTHTSGVSAWFCSPFLNNGSVDEIYKKIFETDVLPSQATFRWGYLDYKRIRWRLKNFQVFNQTVEVWVCQPKYDFDVPAETAVTPVWSTYADFFGKNPNLLTQFAYDVDNKEAGWSSIAPNDYRNTLSENHVWKELFRVIDYKKAVLGQGEEWHLHFGVNECKIDPLRDGVNYVTSDPDGNYSGHWIHRKWQGPVIIIKLTGDTVFDTGSNNKVNIGEGKLAFIQEDETVWSQASDIETVKNYEMNDSAINIPTAAGYQITGANQRSIAITSTFQNPGYI